MGSKPVLSGIEPSRLRAATGCGAFCFCRRFEAGSGNTVSPCQVAKDQPVQLLVVPRGDQCIDCLSV
jgi:hypothetical protein